MNIMTNIELTVRINNAQAMISALKLRAATSVNAMNTAISTLTNFKDMYVAKLTAMQSDLNEIKTFLQTASFDVGKIKSYVSGIISATGNANHVVVYALTYDKDGFYVAPGNDLLEELSGYLDERRLINVTHESTSGMGMIVECCLGAIIRVKKGYVVDEVRRNVQQVMIDLVRGRDFNQSLYLSEIYEAIQLVDGLSSANVSIHLPSGDSYVENSQSGIDEYGNLLLARSEHIISKGIGSLDEVFTVEVL
jgi:hypothetical protein